MLFGFAGLPPEMSNLYLPKQDQQISECVDEFGSASLLEHLENAPIFSPLVVPAEWCLDAVPLQDQPAWLEFSGFHFRFDAHLLPSPTTFIPLVNDFTVAVSDALKDSNTTPSISRPSSRRGSILPPRRGQIKVRIFAQFIKTIVKTSAKAHVLTPGRSPTSESSIPLAPTQPTLVDEEIMTQSLYCSIELSTEHNLAQWSSPGEERSGEIIHPSVDEKLDWGLQCAQIPQAVRSPAHHKVEPNGGELMQLELSKQVPLLEFDATNYEGNVVSAYHSCSVVFHPEKKSTRQTLKRKRGRTECLISPEDQQYFGRKHVDAAKSFGCKLLCSKVNVSPVKHICR